jgi:hypothetical protein
VIRSNRSRISIYHVLNLKVLVLRWRVPSKSEKLCHLVIGLMSYENVSAVALTDKSWNVVLRDPESCFLFMS